MSEGACLGIDSISRVFNYHRLRHVAFTSDSSISCAELAFHKYKREVFKVKHIRTRHI